MNKITRRRVGSSTLLKIQINTLDVLKYRCNSGCTLIYALLHVLAGYSWPGLARDKADKDKTSLWLKVDNSRRRELRKEFTIKVLAGVELKGKMTCENEFSDREPITSKFYVTSRTGDKTIRGPEVYYERHSGLTNFPYPEVSVTNVGSTFLYLSISSQTFHKYKFQFLRLEKRISWNEVTF